MSRLHLFFSRKRLVIHVAVTTNLDRKMNSHYKAKIKLNFCLPHFYQQSIRQNEYHPNFFIRKYRQKTSVILKDDS